MANVTLNFKVPEELRGMIQEEAKKKSISMADMIRIILTEYFERTK